MRFIAVIFGLIMFFGGFAMLSGGSGRTNSTDAMNFVLFLLTSGMGASLIYTGFTHEKKTS